MGTSPPDVPVLPEIAPVPILLRWVHHPEPEVNVPYRDEWIRRVAGWLGAGLDVHVMVHCPNNLHCPDQARDFHQALSRRVRLAPLPEWTVPQATLF